MDREQSESKSQEQVPWDLAGPQPASVRRAEGGAIRGAVRDAGCGTGANALNLAPREQEVWGIDSAPVAIEPGPDEAKERGWGVQFQEANARELGRLGRQFETVIDGRLFHTSSAEGRPASITGLAQVVRPGGPFHLPCRSDREPPGEGPRREAQQTIPAALRDGWAVEGIPGVKVEIPATPAHPGSAPAAPRRGGRRSPARPSRACGRPVHPLADGPHTRSLGRSGRRALWATPSRSSSCR